MPRFWVSLGINEADEDKDSAELRKCYQRLEELSNHYSLTGKSFVTYNLDEAKDVARKAISIWNECGFDCFDFVYICTQPQCPKCNELGRFSDNYCSACGEGLNSSEYVEID
jgi:hypothetical protein